MITKNDKLILKLGEYVDLNKFNFYRNTLLKAQDLEALENLRPEIIKAVVDSLADVDSYSTEIFKNINSKINKELSFYFLYSYRINSDDAFSVLFEGLEAEMIEKYINDTIENKTEYNAKKLYDIIENVMLGLSRDVACYTSNKVEKIEYSLFRKELRV